MIKKILVIAIFSLMMSGCNFEKIIADLQKEVDKLENKNTYYRVGSGEHDRVDLIQLRGCEYFVSYSGMYGVLTLVHAGDCDNPIHKCNCGGEK